MRSALDFLWFSSALEGAKCDEKLQGAFDKSSVAKLVFNARSIAWIKMFDFAPLELKKIEAIASSYGNPKTISDVCSILSPIKPGVLEGGLRECVTLKLQMEPLDASDVNFKKPKGDPVDFAFSYFVFCMWKKIFPSSLAFSQKGNPSKREVRLAANYGDWVAVKKVDLEKTEKKEVLLGLAGIFSSTNQKLPSLYSSNDDGFENAVSALLNSFQVRKSFAKLPALLGEASKIEPGIAEFSSTSEGKAVLREALYLRCFEHAGFPPFVTLESIAGVYPDLKIPKPRGNFGGKKKKK